jgi:hypothetical protein
LAVGEGAEVFRGQELLLMISLAFRLLAGSNEPKCCCRSKLFFNPLRTFLVCRVRFLVVVMLTSLGLLSDINALSKELSNRGNRTGSVAYKGVVVAILS